MSWNYYPDNGLRHFGVSCDNESYAAIQDEVKATLAAYCSSHGCCRYVQHSKFGCKKFVPENTTQCPDCNQMLVWRRLRG